MWENLQKLSPSQMSPEDWFNGSIQSILPDGYKLNDKIICFLSQQYIQVIRETVARRQAMSRYFLWTILVLPVTERSISNISDSEDEDLDEQTKFLTQQYRQMIKQFIDQLLLQVTYKIIILFPSLILIIFHCKSLLKKFHFSDFINLNINNFKI